MKQKPRVQLAKAQVTRPTQRRTANQRRPANRRSSTVREKPTPSKSAGKKRAAPLSQLLTPKTLQESVKTVTNLRGMVKTWLQYLNQADQVLDTLFVTTNSLKESGVLDKLVKQRGKNLTTEDFTNVLMALMNSPLGGQMLKGLGDNGETEPTGPTPDAH